MSEDLGVWMYQNEHDGYLSCCRAGTCGKKQHQKQPSGYSHNPFVGQQWLISPDRKEDCIEANFTVKRGDGATFQAFGMDPGDEVTVYRTMKVCGYYEECPLFTMTCESKRNAIFETGDYTIRWTAGTGKAPAVQKLKVSKEEAMQIASNC